MKKILDPPVKDVPPVRLIVYSFHYHCDRRCFAGLAYFRPETGRRPTCSSFFLHRLRYLRHPDWWYSTPGPIVSGVVILGLIRLGGLGPSPVVTLFLRRRLDLSMQITRVYKRQYLGSSPFAPHHYVFYLCLRGFRFFSSNAALCPYVWGKGIWISVFLSVSACNAGFDILGFLKPHASSELFVGDPLVCLTICCLIILGGINFIVTVDSYNWEENG